jgi:predicted RNase H-like HicB family nuclease
VEERSLQVEVHYEGGMYWAQVKEWPGCFASGENLDELTEALEEAIGLYRPAWRATLAAVPANHTTTAQCGRPRRVNRASGLSPRRI